MNDANNLDDCRMDINALIETAGFDDTILIMSKTNAELRELMEKKIADIQATLKEISAKLNLADKENIEIASNIYILSCKLVVQAIEIRILANIKHVRLSGIS